jgi:hypothetical protein
MIIIGMHPDVRRDLPLFGELDHVHGRRVAPFSITIVLREDDLAFTGRSSAADIQQSARKRTCAPEQIVARLKFSGRIVAWSIRTMKKLDLIDWTMQEARELNPEHHIPSDLEGTPSFNKLLEVLEGEPVQPNSDDTIFRIAMAPSIQLANEVTSEPKPNTVSNLPAPTEAATGTPADGGLDPKSALLIAIVEPDIYTAPVDRDRAIILRWVLRDIRSNRLKLSPVNQQDLRDLIDMGLAEMRNDAPVLTNIGVNAII